MLLASEINRVHSVGIDTLIYKWEYWWVVDGVRDRCTSAAMIGSHVGSKFTLKTQVSTSQPSRAQNDPVA